MVGNWIKVEDLIFLEMIAVLQVDRKRYDRYIFIIIKEDK